MTDVFDATKRSEVMSSIRSRGNVSTEIAMVKLLRMAGITGWRRHIKMKPPLAPEDIARARANHRIVLRPDFVFSKHRIVIFVDGCLWHGCPLHARRPRQNTEFWEKKLGDNIARDLAAGRALELARWKVVRVWEHEMREPQLLLMRLKEEFARAPTQS